MESSSERGEQLVKSTLFLWHWADKDVGMDGQKMRRAFDSAIKGSSAISSSFHR